MQAGMQMPQNMIALDQSDPHAMFALGFAMASKLTGPTPNPMVGQPHVVAPSLGPVASVPSGGLSPEMAQALLASTGPTVGLQDLLKAESMKQMASSSFGPIQHPLVTVMPPLTQAGPVGLKSAAENLAVSAQLQFSRAHGFPATTEQLAAMQAASLHSVNDATQMQFAQLRNFQMGGQAGGQDVHDMHPGGSEKVELVTPRNRRKQEDRGPIALTRARLEELFNGSLQQASKTLGICPTAIKKACRRFGISKWPYKSPNPGPKPKRLRAMIAAANGDAAKTGNAESEASDVRDAAGNNVGNQADDNSEFSEGSEGEDASNEKPQANATAQDQTSVAIAGGADDCPEPELENEKQA